jgi:hypothetical protein
MRRWQAQSSTTTPSESVGIATGFLVAALLPSGRPPPPSPFHPLSPPPPPSPPHTPSHPPPLAVLYAHAQPDGFSERVLGPPCPRARVCAAGRGLPRAGRARAGHCAKGVGCDWRVLGRGRRVNDASAILMAGGGKMFAF